MGVSLLNVFYACNGRTLLMLTPAGLVTHKSPKIIMNDKLSYHRFWPAMRTDLSKGFKQYPITN